jgi:LPPG:FO 2-phospho-L-lactate transferase
MLVALTGGTGGAKLVQGLSCEIDAEGLAIVCNTGDDFVLHGLHISPDLDTIAYTLAGAADAARGWGIQGDTFAALEWLGKYGGEDWFKLGDRDLATHLTRTRLLRDGLTLAQATEKIAAALGVKAMLLPMSNESVETRIQTSSGEISFQEYFVKRRWAVEVKGVSYQGAQTSRPAPGVLDAIRDASAVIVCPSNPVTSVGPILAVPGVRAALKETAAKIVAVSPLIGGKPVTGPADRLMRAVGMEVSALGVAKAYADFLALFVLAPEDKNYRTRIEALGVKTAEKEIRMNMLDDKRRLARELLALL